MFFPAAGGDLTTVRDAAPWETTLLVLSHAGFPLVAAYVMGVLGDYYLGAHAVAVFIFSNIYHLCRGTPLCFGMTLEHARLLDHITSLSATMAVLLSVLYLHPTAGVTARVLLPFVTAYAVLAFPFQTQALVVIAATLMVLVADRYMRQGAMAVPSLARFDVTGLVTAATLASIAYALFLINGWGYAIPHALWHVLVSAALYFAAAGLRRHPTRSPWGCRRQNV